ncbi:hypothetical protein CALVIDRAFT_563636 [Calocera viscosa TUFC12733]|uniref:DUF4604 domain-containing protein n=1 Tax=Calocera viscosa (strain TUFC12733) TaxID=1330018 RepID=A0A167MBQ6_CALVF|nr:hypothetical protein CALVIDRAFT_563636 [Calocera viscosa TUFC12733]
MSRQPNRVQLSKLAYEENVPAFLQRFKARISGQPVDEDEPSYDEEDGGGEWEKSGDGRPDIPRRPGIPERPKEGEWGSNKIGKDGPGPSGKDDDDEGDDAPQIVVLKTGKHLSAEDVDNERRAAKGLPPLPNAQPSGPSGQSLAPPTTTMPPKENNSMSFSSSKKVATGVGASSKKRKIIGADDDESPPTKEMESKPSKKPKKMKKGLLSFQDDDG